MKINKISFIGEIQGEKEKGILEHSNILHYNVIDSHVDFRLSYI